MAPFAPGGATDIVVRMLGPRLSERLGQQIVVDNRPGAAGDIAVELVATAQSDGYTLLVGNISTNSINPILFAGKMKVNALKDLTGVTLLASIPNLILGSPKIPARTLEGGDRVRLGAPRPARFLGAARVVLPTRHARAHRRGGDQDGAPAFKGRRGNAAGAAARRHPHHGIERRVQYRRSAYGAGQGVCRDCRKAHPGTTGCAHLDRGRVPRVQGDNI
ncbi:MAG: hypothetical protein HY323_12225 [Betaproteobacteria bacterium]|nr:hypothetical protein [Betaproteobacteria bacterium]